jgi:hypothetical protein
MGSEATPEAQVVLSGCVGEEDFESSSFTQGTPFQVLVPGSGPGADYLAAPAANPPRLSS